MSELKQDVKKMIISSLNLEDMKPDDIAEDTALFGDDGLGLDSVDALELGLAVQKEFGIEMNAKESNLKEVFLNVNSLSKYIKERKG